MKVKSFSYIRNYPEFLCKSQVNFIKNFNKKVKSSDIKITNYCIIRTIGIGSFGRILLAKNKATLKYVAIKMISKHLLVSANRADLPINERNLLRSLYFPFIIRLKETFQDFTYIYLVMPYISGGDVFHYIRRYGKMEESVARFYAGQLCLAIEFLHYLNIVYRDLKTENIVLNSNGNLKLIDFGLAKVFDIF